MAASINVITWRCIVPKTCFAMTGACTAQEVPNAIWCCDTKGKPVFPSQRLSSRRRRTVIPRREYTVVPSLIPPCAQKPFSLQQGLIFIGNSAEKLLEGAKPYHIQYGPPPSRPAGPRSRSSSTSSSSRDQERLTLLESLYDGEISQAYRRHLTRAPPLSAMADDLGRRHDRVRDRRFDSGLPNWPEIMDVNLSSDHEADRSGGLASTGYLDNCDWPSLEPLPANATEVTRAPTPPPFTVDAESDDGASDGDDRDEFGGLHNNLPPPPIWADRTERVADRMRSVSRSHRAPLTDYQSDNNSSDDEMRWTTALLEEPPRPSSLFARPPRRSTPGRIEPPSPIVGQPKEGETLLTPNGKFFMSKHRSRISVKFDPPM